MPHIPPPGVARGEERTHGPGVDGHVRLKSFSRGGLREGNQGSRRGWGVKRNTARRIVAPACALDSFVGSERSGGFLSVLLLETVAY